MSKYQMQVSDFDFELPKELIAERPAADRTGSRLMVLDRATGEVKHKAFPDVLGYLKKGDVLVLNDTKVFPARLIGKKRSGGKVELLLIRRDNVSGEGKASHPYRERWQCMCRSSKKFSRAGVEVVFPLGAGELRATYAGPEFDTPEGLKLFDLECDGAGTQAELFRVINEAGAIPLPPYITREADALDEERYQTVFASSVGAVAAPTAGLHFTGALLEDIKGLGVIVCFVTLHTGPATFLPVRVEDIENHKVPTESFVIPKETHQLIRKAVTEGRRVIAVGTTVTRTLEFAAGDILASGEAEELSGEASLFIYPPFEFRIVDTLITNFHLPASSLIMLVSAFAGTDKVREAYVLAVKERYRFFSYGDSMLIL